MERERREVSDTSPSGGGWEEGEEAEPRLPVTPRASGRPWGRARVGSVYLPGENKLSVIRNKHTLDVQRILSVATQNHVVVQGDPIYTSEGDEYVLTANSLLFEEKLRVAAGQVDMQWLVNKEVRELPDPHMSSLKTRQETIVLMCSAKAAPRFPKSVYICCKSLGLSVTVLGAIILIWLCTIPYHALH
jgi:hypothetical protein